jgi:hypothetical protein
MNQSICRYKTMKTRLETALTTTLDHSLFALACLLLASVLFTAKLMADDIMVAQDSVSEIFGMPFHAL